MSGAWYGECIPPGVGRRTSTAARRGPTRVGTAAPSPTLLARYPECLSSLPGTHRVIARVKEVDTHRIGVCVHGREGTTEMKAE
jgi:hypothetical protein